MSRISSELAEQRRRRVGRISAALEGFFRTSLEPVAYALQEAPGRGVVFPDPADPVARPVYRFLVVARREDPPTRHLSTRSEADPELGEGWALEAVWDLHTGEQVVA